MKKRFFVIITLLIAIVVMVLLLNSKKTTTQPEESTSQSSSAPEAQVSGLSIPREHTVSTQALPDKNPPSPSLQPENLAFRASEVAPPPGLVTNIPPTIVLENIRRAVRQYCEMFGGDPVGTNPEITSALNGNNSKQINFIKPEAGMQINENGELVDAWGTPLFFHQLSGTEMEIHSAGQDKKMWTRDDLVTK